MLSESSSGGDRQEHVDNAHDRIVEATPHRTSDDAETGANRKSQPNGDKSTCQGMNGPVDDARIEIAPERIGSEQMIGARPLQLRATDALKRVVACEERGGDRPEENRTEDKPGKGQSYGYTAQPRCRARTPLALCPWRRNSVIAKRIEGRHATAPVLVLRRGSSTG